MPVRLSRVSRETAMPNYVVETGPSADAQTEPGEPIPLAMQIQICRERWGCDEDSTSSDSDDFFGVREKQVAKKKPSATRLSAAPNSAASTAQLLADMRIKALRAAQSRADKKAAASAATGRH